MIRVLPPEVVNQIAAGEVVERPFSVVKELVENSLDAGAKRLHVSIVEGGRESIRITDDGCGFSAGDLELAFVSHATSKLASLADLDHIASLGFRGEALASIGSIARTRICSRLADSDGAYEIRCDGGKLSGVRPAAHPPGTTVEICDLFFNTPARRRFLKTPRAERGRIQDLLLRLALARPDVDFVFEVDGKEALRLPADEPLESRIRRGFGRTVGSALHAVEQRFDAYAVTGFVGDPDLARRDSALELLFVNGRLARDKASGYAIRQAYREFMMGGRFPVYFLMLSLPPGEVDVNVHPTKSEVRFLDGRRVCGMLHDAVRAGLAGRAGAESSPSIAVGRDKPRASTGFPKLAANLFGAEDAMRTASPSRSDLRTDGDVGARTGAEAWAPHVAEPAATRIAPLTERPNPFCDAVDRRFLQVADLYIVFESADGGLVVVDQHALHERVMYERLVARHAARDEVAVSQQLLVPEIIELGAADKAYLLDARDALAAEGLALDDFSGNSIAIHAVPAVLDRVRPAALVESFLRADGGRPTTIDAIHERFHSMACRSSVMSGDALTQDEIHALLVEASRLEHPHNCPHGRPTVLNFSATELERFFRRRV